MGCDIIGIKYYGFSVVLDGCVKVVFVVVCKAAIIDSSKVWVQFNTFAKKQWVL